MTKTQIEVIDKPEVSQDKELQEHNRASICQLVDYWDGVCNVDSKSGTDKLLRTLYAKWYKAKSDKPFEEWCAELSKPFGARCSRILNSNRGLDMTKKEAERRFGEDCNQNVIKAFKWLAGLLGSPTGNIADYKFSRKGEPRERIISSLLGS